MSEVIRPVMNTICAHAHTEPSGEYVNVGRAIIDENSQFLAEPTPHPPKGTQGIMVGLHVRNKLKMIFKRDFLVGMQGKVGLITG